MASSVARDVRCSAPPPPFADWLPPFLVAFTSGTRRTGVALAVGAGLAAGRRTVADRLRALGRACDPVFAAFHRVLSRNTYPALVPAHAALRALVAAFATDPVVIGLGHTLERRPRDHVHGTGPFADAVRPHARKGERQPKLHDRLGAWEDAGARRGPGRADDHPVRDRSEGRRACARSCSEGVGRSPGAEG